MFYNICKYQLVSSEIWYTNPDGLQREEVLSRLFEEDFALENRKIVLSDEHFEHVYSHVYLDKPENGAALMKIANRYVNADDDLFWKKYPWEDREFATVMIISKKESTCLYIEENEKAFANVEELIKILCRGVNLNLNREKLSMVPSAHIDHQQDTCGIMCACAVISNQVDKAILMNAANYNNRPRPFDEKAALAGKLFVSSLVDEPKAALATSTLYEMTKPLVKRHKSAKAILAILRAAMDARVMVRPSYKDFVEVMGCDDIVDEKKYSRYTGPRYTGYYKYGLYHNAFVTFSKIKTMKL